MARLVPTSKVAVDGGAHGSLTNHLRFGGIPMWTRNRLTFSLALLVMGSTLKASATETLVGAVTGGSQDSVQLKTNEGAERAVTLDSKTRYVRWITHRPWQQSTAADRSFVQTGRCIAAELRDDHAHAAKMVRINTDEIGTIFCPCRGAR
jgi:hypothetical protein